MELDECYKVEAKGANVQIKFGLLGFYAKFADAAGFLHCAGVLL